VNQIDKKPVGKTLFSTLLTLLVISVALYFSYHWLQHKPKAHKYNRSHSQQNATLVEVMKPLPTDISVHVQSYGTVIPYRTQTLASRISSQVTVLSETLIPGSIITKDEHLISLDPTDYALMLKEKEASVANTKLTLQTEYEKQKSAQYDFSILKQKVSPEQRSYLLRYPHIEAAKANLKAQEAAYEKAKQDLERCNIYAPFDAVVLTVDVAVGDMVNSAKTLATLAKTEAFWVKVALTPERLKGIDIPHYNATSGSIVQVRHDFWAKETPSLSGIVQSVEKMLDNESKMAYLLIRVDDPLLRKTHQPKQKPLLLNGFVSVNIEGKRLKHVLKVPHILIHNNDTVWVMQKDHTLHIKHITKLWQDQTFVYLPETTLNEGESLIRTYLETPVEGMPLRTAHDTKSDNNGRPHQKVSAKRERS